MTSTGLVGSVDWRDGLKRSKIVCELAKWMIEDEGTTYVFGQGI